jgi:glycogen operon protein
MTDADWGDDGLHQFGMFLSGDPLRAPGPRGEQLQDASFLIWFNAHPEPGTVSLPDQDWVKSGEVVLSTDEGYTAGQRVEAGDELEIAPRSMLVLRQV